MLRRVADACALSFWLTGIPYMMGADGWPRVLQAVLLERLGGSKHSR